MSEVRLIDANALKETAMVKFGDDITSITLFKIFEELIDNAPTVEYTFEEAFQKTVCENRLYCPARPQGETNAEIFKQTFGIYATELWSMKEADLLKWLNMDVRGNQE